MLNESKNILKSRFGQRAAGLLLLSLLLLAPFTPRAQDGRQVQAQQDKESTGQQQQAKKEQDAKKRQQHSAEESFRPSEEISEDLSVSFPVDI